MTLGVGVTVRSKTTTLLLALPTNMVFPSAVTMIPHGHDNGFTPLARDAQHCAPVNPPNRPFGPNPGSENEPVRQPNRVKFPKAETIGGIPPPGIAEGTHGLALLPACATSFAPPMVFTTTLLMVSTTTMSRPMRSETKSRWLRASIQL